MALEAAREAGETVMRWFRTAPEVRHKGPDQPVTDADLAADALLAHRLLGAYPGDGWLSEETEDRPERLDRERVWIVDPIDGTRSFVAGYPEFAISVALAEAGEAVLGVVYNPAREDLLWAVRGGGAYRERPWRGGRPEASAPLRIPEPGPGKVRILASRSEIARGRFASFAASWEVVPLGSTAYKLACVAGGDADGYVGWGPKHEWDVAAAALIVEEAGGRATDLAGSRYRYNRPDPRWQGTVGAAPGCHTELLRRMGRREAQP